MGLALLNFSINMSDIECCVCHTTFAVTEEAHTKLRQTGQSFWCPMCGKAQSYNDNENGRLRKQLEDERRRKEAILADANSLRDSNSGLRLRLRAQQGATTKLRNRAKNGVCPCCTRTFSNMAAHMKSEHPDFKP